MSRWWFQRFVIFSSQNLGNDQIWLIFFRWVESKPPTVPFSLVISKYLNLIKCVMFFCIYLYTQQTKTACHHGMSLKPTIISSKRLWLFWGWVVAPTILSPHNYGSQKWVPPIGSLPFKYSWLVVSNIFYFHPYWGNWSNLTSIFFKWVETTN